MPELTSKQMQRTKFTWRRLAAALGIGLGIEILAICVANFLPPRWGGLIGDLPLQPAEYSVRLLPNAAHSGFEGQVGYLFLVMVVQWVIYSAVVYLWLAVSRKKQEVSTPGKEYP